MVSGQMNGHHPASRMASPASRAPGEWCHLVRPCVLVTDAQPAAK